MDEFEKTLIMKLEKEWPHFLLEVNPNTLLGWSESGSETHYSNEGKKKGKGMELLRSLCTVRQRKCGIGPGKHYELSRLRAFQKEGFSSPTAWRFWFSHPE